MQQSQPQSEEEGRPDWLQSIAAEKDSSNNTSNEFGAAMSSANEDFSHSHSTATTESPLPLIQRLQSAAAILSLLLSPIVIILVGLWAHALGGVAWSQGQSPQVFNWHPILMICAYAFMNVGVLIFRISGTSSYHSSIRSSTAPASAVVLASDGSKERKRGMMKFTHGTVWSFSFIFGIIAMLAVFKSHNDPINGYIANLYSLHSWIGVFVLSLYTLQFLYGILAFGGLLRRGRLNHPILMEIHKFTGTYIHILVTATILLGIQEKEGFVDCSYAVEEADLFPMSNYGKIPSACKLSHAMGLVVLAMGLLTSFALARFPVL